MLVDSMSTDNSSTFLMLAQTIVGERKIVNLYMVDSMLALRHLPADKMISGVPFYDLSKATEAGSHPVTISQLRTVQRQMRQNLPVLVTVEYGPTKRKPSRRYELVSIIRVNTYRYRELVPSEEDRHFLEMYQQCADQYILDKRVEIAALEAKEKKKEVSVQSGKKKGSKPKKPKMKRKDMRYKEKQRAYY